MSAPGSTRHLPKASLLLATGVVLAGVLLFSCRERAADRGADGQLASPTADSSRAPNFTLPDLNGQEVRLSDFQGRVVLLDFWATWCGPCRMEVPHFKELVQKYGDRGFVVLGVALDETGAEVVKPFVEKNEIRYPVVIGDQYTAGRYGGVSALPTTFLIDRQGRIVKKYIGYRDLGTFTEDIEPLL